MISLNFLRDILRASQPRLFICKLSVFSDENGKYDCQPQCQDKGQGAYYFVYRTL